MTELAEIVGDSAGVVRLREQLEQILKRAATARRPPAIFIRGETGTGKGLVARTLHRAGPRASAPFVDVNCAAIPDNLLEAELFGYERGAFTDARQSKPGLFQLAHRGMLFLDEIGMLPPALQVKLLKVLEDGVVRRLGGTRTEPVDAWIVSATNEDLAEALRARRFREDLYHRLAVLSLELPPLRERGSDVLVLADRFLARACTDYGLPPKMFARDARAALTAYGWPGNVRELGNVVERVALLVDEPVITAAMLALPVTTTADDRPGDGPARAMSSRDQMRAHLLEVLSETGGNISQTAVRLGVARNTVLARMARFGLTASTFTVAQPASPRPGGVPPPEAPVTTLVDAMTAVGATPRVAWEPHRVALLRVDVVVNAAAGSVDARRTLEEMIGKAQTFGGDLVDLGPGVLVAAFGLEAVEDAPVRAALAALAILKRSERAHRNGEGPRVKIVVHVANVLVSRHQGTGAIDLESKRAAWTTIEALVGLDELDTIVVSEGSAPFLERRFELVSATATEAAAVPFRRLTRRERTGFGLGGRPLSRFVGRDGELRLVSDRLASAERGQGQVIGIVGEPGVGKSRFVYEFTRIDPMHGWRVLGCGGASHGSTTPLLPVGDLLRRYFAIEDADEPDLIREKVTETVMSRHEALRSFLTPLLSLLDITVEDPAWASLDPPQRRQHIQDAVKRLLLNESRIQPLLLIVEDLQWIDAETQALLDGLVESLPTARVLLLVDYRPEYQHRWGSKTYYSQLRLDALLPESAGELLDALLGDDPALQPLKQLLVERRNPFVIEESIQTLVETRALVGERGAHRPTRSIQAIEVPATVQVILAARIDRLPPEDKQLLQTASVIGKDVPFVLLHAVGEAAEDDVHQGLAHLRAAEFLYETRLSPDLEYTFKHALTHEVAYGTLVQDRRTALHARIVGAIERIYPERLTEHVERLAHHAVRGELWEKAALYLRQAGLKAAARSVLEDARAWFEQALGALETLPESQSTLEQAFEIRLELRPVLTLLGEVRPALERLHEAGALAERLNDDRKRARVCALMTNVHYLLGELDEARASGTRALAIAQRLGNLELRIVATTYLEQVHYFRGEYERVVELATDNLAALPVDWVYEHFGSATPASVSDRRWLVMSLAELGRFAEAVEYATEAIQLAEPTHHANTVGMAHYASGVLHLLRGDWAKARSMLEPGIAAFREGHVVLQLRLAVPPSAWVLAELGEATEALNRIRTGEQLLERYAASGVVAALGRSYHALGRACLLLGRLDEARRLGDRAIESSLNILGNEAHALHLLGDIATHPDGFDAACAEAHYREALALAEPRGMRPLVAHCHLGLGKLYRRTGRPEQAREHLTTATTMYREMGMQFWLEHVETETTEMA